MLAIKRNATSAGLPVGGNKGREADSLRTVSKTTTPSVPTYPVDISSGHAIRDAVTQKSRLGSKA